MIQPEAGPPRVVIAGGSGFIGRALAQALAAQGYAPVILSRQPAGPSQLHWDGVTLGDWARAVDGAAAVVNLAGRNISSRFTPENLRDIVASRVDSINVLAQAIRAAAAPPPVWINAGGKDLYGNTGAALLDEFSPPGQGALVDICMRWERAFDAAQVARTRKVMLRMGLVLGDEGVLAVLARLTRLFLGGASGDGRQYMSWIHLTDMLRMIQWAQHTSAATGAYNATAPNPVTNAEFMRVLRRVLKRPWSPPVPAPVVRIGARLMGSEGALVLEGNRVLPRRALEQGFSFIFPDLEPALRDLL